jgi:hypothetical protein
MRVSGQRHAMATLPLGKCLRAPCTRDLVKTQGLYGRAWRKEHLFPPMEIEHRTVQPVPSRYTKYTALTPSLCTKLNMPFFFCGAATQRRSWPPHS